MPKGPLVAANSTAASTDTVQRVQSVGSDGTVGGTSPSVSTATLTNVNDTASSTTLAAANTSRKGLYIYNDSTVVLYVKYGTTASTTSYTVQIAAAGFWEMPTSPVYTGRVDGIWASDASGAARITEL